MPLLIFKACIIVVLTQPIPGWTRSYAYNRAKAFSNRPHRKVTG